MHLWRNLPPEEIRDFVQWALENWKPDTQINNVWHPVVRSTWGKLDEAFATAKRQILADYKDLSESVYEAIE
jgi:trehalose/maltose hydrolase-like predicted phosphorylase